MSYGLPRQERAGVVIGDRIVDVADAMTSGGHDIAGPSMTDLLQMPEWLAHLEGARLGDRDGTPLDSVRLGAPVPRPGSVFVVGANTYSHVEEASIFTLGAPPLEPMILAKASSAVVGPNDPIIRPAVTAKLDYEVELGVIIGRRARWVDEADALDAVAGYTVVNDASARDVQLAEGEPNVFYRAHYLGKSFDSFCPAGPWMVTTDELPDPTALRLQTWVNGDLRQDGSTSDLCFGIARLVSYLSSILTLEPGDLICSGSPAGVAAFRPPGAYLKPGDVVRCEVEGVGHIENPVVSEAVARSSSTVAVG